MSVNMACPKAFSLSESSSFAEPKSERRVAGADSCWSTQFPLIVLVTGSPQVEARRFSTGALFHEASPGSPAAGVDASSARRCW